MTNDPRPTDHLPTASFTVLDGLAAGLSARELRSPGLIIPSRGIRVPAEARETLLGRAAPTPSCTRRRP
ncbi:hypothetical protein [Sinomonas mesophila]|uniref:hypothetical protein n=1 Tax=Sinomonas mesophila TaxID=1531955 RepID=UPI000985989E|nr:hypothetical protein [Sinomonas mesophila]